MDTKAFYTDEELAIDKKLEEHRGRRRQLKQVMIVLEQFYNQERTEKSALKRLRELKYCDKALEQVPPRETIDELKSEIRNIAPVLNELKADMLALLNTYDGVRSYRPEYIQDKYVISIFESSLTRTLGIPTATLTKELVVVKACYFKILKDIILNGFIMNRERYVCLTASAGQLRTKRSVFIRESAWEAHQNTLMCGLTIEHINEVGGINTNKFLAYLALCNSATEPWPEFDIAKTIVVDDMETFVNGVVDFIDDKTYAIERKEMGVPITHTDGCGMVRLGVSRKNFMVRLPWVKGLLAAFPFDKFIREANKAVPTVNHGIVKDIYGVEHDILAEDIQVIFTKSQFKMHKYYQNWAIYQQNFIKYGCEACICNEEPDIFDRAKINYQMLQTLTDLTDDELLEVSAETRRRLNNISSNKETMLQVFGATQNNPRRSPFQESLLIYPELLQDEYTRETLREIKKSIEKAARAGRLDIDGYYTFLIPDMYAFCQWLFLGQKEPKGLLRDGEVYCDLFEPGSELDCLRSPHLYIEHAIRTNMFGCDEERKRWFVTSGIYVSCHDLISKIIMCDWDGDKSLVVSNNAIINAAKRNLNGIVPLYYEMKKAGAKSITSEEIYNSMIAAYTGGNIGQISNDITKIWNSNVDSSAIDVVKLLCLENNFTID